MRRALHAVVLAILLFATPQAFAVLPDEVLSDPVLEQRARSLSKGLRCMVCQNQSIDDSDAPLARDLRILVRDRLKQGDSDRQVREFLVTRYGEFVLLQPRMTWRTGLLWFAPPALLIGGAVVLLVFARRRRKPDSDPASNELTPAERQRLESLTKQ